MFDGSVQLTRNVGSLNPSFAYKNKKIVIHFDRDGQRVPADRMEARNIYLFTYIPNANLIRNSFRNKGTEFTCFHLFLLFFIFNSVFIIMVPDGFSNWMKWIIHRLATLNDPLELLRNKIQFWASLCVTCGLWTHRRRFARCSWRPNLSPIERVHLWPDQAYRPTGGNRIRPHRIRT